MTFDLHEMDDRLCECFSPPTKVLKLEEKTTNSSPPPVSENGTNESENNAKEEEDPPNRHQLPPLSQFSIDQILFEDAKSKTAAVAGHFAGSTDETAVIVAEKTPFTHANLPRLFTKESKFSTNTRNNIYSQLEAACGGGLGDVRLMTVYPATEAHIKKYSHQICHVIHETPENYATVTKPFIQSQSFDIQWVYNILDSKEEQDRVVYQDPHPETGFVLLPDFKWDQRELQNLYLLAICRKRGIWSLRELGREHLPLLKNILEKGKEAIHEKYGVPGDQLRIYLHYQPSYYHLHVHFTQLSYTAPKSCVGEAHLLADVISNIETIDPEYYQKCSLSFTVTESSLLRKAYQEHQ